jgi:hypothetical protein
MESMDFATDLWTGGVPLACVGRGMDPAPGLSAGLLVVFSSKLFQLDKFILLAWCFGFGGLLEEHSLSCSKARFACTSKADGSFIQPLCLGVGLTFFLSLFPPSATVFPFNCYKKARDSSSTWAIFMLGVFTKL